MEQGNDTEDFYRVASALVLMATIPLGLGICGDLFVLVFRVGGSLFYSGLVAGAMLLLIYGLWFGWTGWKRSN